MFYKISNLIQKLRWVIIVFWIAAALAIFLTAPNLSSLASSNNQNFLPADAGVKKAEVLINRLYPEQKGKSNVLLVFYNKEGLNNVDKEYMEGIYEYLLQQGQKLHIDSVSSPLEDKNLENILISENKKALILVARLSLASHSEGAEEFVAFLRDRLAEGKPEAMEVHITGESAISKDMGDAVDLGMMRTTIITLILLAIILLAIYRSPVAPFIPLFIIGLSFVISRSIIALLATVGLNISTYSETFLVAVLFGAGTDYCLLIISRFKEELASGKGRSEAVADTMKNTIGAVVSSGGTVIIGFAFMIFAKFGLFNTTGPSVAIGVFITLLIVTTLTPSLLYILGEKVFWPASVKSLAGRSGDYGRGWERLAKHVVKHPVRIIIICLVIFLPFAVTSRFTEISFNQLKELSSEADSMRGFKVVEDNFNQGEVFPVSLVLKTDKDLWSQDGLQAVEDLAALISGTEGVAVVRTATRPDGKVISEASLDNQLKEMRDGLVKMDSGISDMQDGLDEIKGGIGKASDGIGSGSESIGKLAVATADVAKSIDRIYSGMSGIDNGVNKNAQGLAAVTGALKQVSASIGAFVEANPMLKKDTGFMTAYMTIGRAAEGTDMSGRGLIKTSEGIKELSSALISIKAGLEKLADGQKKAGNGLDTASSALDKLERGITPIKDGLTDIKDGVASISDLTGEYASKGDSLKNIFILPDNVFTDFPELKDAMEMYITSDGKGLKMDIALSISPYTKDALDKTEELSELIGMRLKGTYLEDAEFHLSGASATYADVRAITASDFNNVMIFVLFGIFVVLAILLRSLVAPIYLLFTILLSYFGTVGISYLFFKFVLGYEGLNWAVQFFAFCVLVALGIDYNIFLMTRVREEYKPGQSALGVEKALSSTGRIITSCGIIMAGTFGAIMASPLLSMVQVGFTTVVGLLLDTFIIRCLLVPALAVKMGELNWWPGRKVRVIPAAGENENE